MGSIVGLLGTLSKLELEPEIIRVIQSQSLMVSCNKYKPQKAVRFSTLLQK